MTGIVANSEGAFVSTDSGPETETVPERGDPLDDGESSMLRDYA
jgi:hypothetical protein